MGLLVGVGDFGIGDLIARAEALYALLEELCGDSLSWENIINKPTTLAGYGITDDLKLTGALPSSIGAALAVGSAVTAARADHVHTVNLLDDILNVSTSTKTSLRNGKLSAKRRAITLSLTRIPAKLSCLNKSLSRRHFHSEHVIFIFFCTILKQQFHRTAFCHWQFLKNIHGHILL